jgi:hypothetical protein
MPLLAALHDMRQPGGGHYRGLLLDDAASLQRPEDRYSNHEEGKAARNSDQHPNLTGLRETLE